MRAWEDFLEQQEKILGKEIVNKWLRPLKIMRFDACNLYLETEDSFRIAWFEEHVQRRAEKAFLNNNHKPIKVHLSLTSQQKKILSAKQLKKPLPFSKNSFALKFDELDRVSIFENYVVSDDSLLAYKLLNDTSMVDRTSSPLFNPVYLYGRSGTGKTHLLMATTTLLQKKGIKALYVRAETFTQHVVDAIRTAEMQAFRKAYRSVDALLIDHIEIFSRKAATQEEFFHTFNALHLERKLIVLSSTVLPSELKLIEPRLISRFEWGIVIPLQMPTKEQMHSILLKRAERLNIALDEMTVSFLLNTFGGNTKSLIRALDALVLRTHLYPNKDLQSISLKNAQALLKDLIAEEQKEMLTSDKIIRAVSEYYGMRVDDILGKSQARDCALPRQIAMHLCRQQLNLPFMKIGEIFARDHSTVMTSVRQIQKSLDCKNHDVISPVNGILKLLER